jgi:hypothetical protein
MVLIIMCDLQPFDDAAPFPKAKSLKWRDSYKPCEI